MPREGQTASTAALVAAVDFNAREFERLDAAGTFDKVVAVDAGFAHLEAIGRAPDVAIGDFDSLGYVPAAPCVRTYPSRKDASDLELALAFAREDGCQRVFVFGALAARLDHTVANLQIFARYAEAGLQVFAVADTGMLHILVGPGTFAIPARTGIVSVFSASDEARGVTERGMAYAFDNESVSNRTSRGLSNELLGQPASVSVEAGTLYVFYPFAEDGASAPTASL